MKTRKQTIEHPITNLERLAAELRKIRRGRKVSQQELSDRAKVARRTITNAEVRVENYPENIASAR